MSVPAISPPGGSSFLPIEQTIKIEDEPIPRALAELQTERRKVVQEIRMVQRDLLDRSRSSMRIMDSEYWTVARNAFNEVVNHKHQLLAKKLQLTQEIESQVDYTYLVMDDKEHLGTDFQIKNCILDGAILTIELSELAARSALYLHDIEKNKLRVELVSWPGNTSSIFKFNIEELSTVHRELSMGNYVLLEIMKSRVVKAAIAFTPMTAP